MTWVLKARYRRGDNHTVQGIVLAFEKDDLGLSIAVMTRMHDGEQQFWFRPYAGSADPAELTSGPPRFSAYIPAACYPEVHRAVQELLGVVREHDGLGST